MRTTQFVSIVEDDESIRLAIASLVRSLGWQVQPFGSAEAFLRSGQLEGTACLISDVQMPGMSGVEMQDRLNRDGLLPPTIFITAFPTPALREKALAYGAVAFLSKPADTNEILHYLRLVLDKP